MTVSIIVYICFVVNIVLTFCWIRMFASLEKRRQKLEELVDKYQFGLIDAYADGGRLIIKIMRERISNVLEKGPQRDCFAEWLVKMELGVEELRKERKEAIKNRTESSVKNNKNKKYGQ